VLGGAMIVFVAIVTVLPLVVGRLAGVVGWLPSRLFGVTGRMATTNARRNPRRAAAITTALMIGTSLLSLFSVVLATFRVQETRELAENFPVDFAVSPANYGAAQTDLPEGMVDQLRRRPELGVVVRARVGFTRVGADQTEVSAVDPTALGTQVTPEIMTGSLADLKLGTVALRRDYAENEGVGVGDRLPVGWFGGTEFTVVATYDDTPTRGDALLLWSDFDAAVGPRSAEQILVRRAAGVDADAAHAALDTVLAAFPLVTVASSAEQRDALLAELNKRQAQFIGLLGMSTLIAVLGIMNTLALSVLERTRESATLRALGLSARQLRRMLVLEALIMALVAAIIGVAFGVGFGWVTAGSLIGTYGHGWPQVPVLQLLGYLALPAVAGMVAAVLPARRATRASITAAMADT
jgi:putative ABC transport system permease protein